MTDDRAWQAPGGPTNSGKSGASVPPVPPSGGPVYGPTDPPPPAPGPLSVGATPPTPAKPGWTPPPKPGLIPLRPLDLGTLLGASFRVLRRNPKPTFGFALIVQTIVTIVSLVLIGGPTIASLLRVQSAAPEDESAIIAGTVAFSLVSGFLAVVLSFVANAWLQGIIVIEVARATLGEKLTLRGLWGYAKGRIGALLGWSLLVGLALFLVIAILAGIIALLVVTLGPLGIGLGVLIGILGGLGLLVVGVWISTKLSLVPSALMIERLSLRAAIARSWSLTRGYFWKVFGIQLLVAAILGLAMNIISTPFSIIGAIVVALVDPNGTGAESTVVIVLVLYVVQLVITLVLSAISAVITTGASALIYLDLRIRTEGLDLKLTSYVEAQQAGQSGLSDPYLPDPPPGTPAGPTFV